LECDGGPWQWVQQVRNHHGVKHPVFKRERLRIHFPDLHVRVPSVAYPRSQDAQHVRAHVRGDEATDLGSKALRNESGARGNFEYLAASLQRVRDLTRHFVEPTVQLPHGSVVPTRLVAPELVPRRLFF